MSVTVPAARVVYFDNFVLNLQVGELRKRGVKLHLQGQPLQILGILVQRPGDLVTREELRAQLWPSDTFVDFDHSLHNSIARIREVLGDSAAVPRYIETLPRRGYRFIARAEEVNTKVREFSPGPNDSDIAPVITAQSRVRGRVVFMLFFICAIGVGGWFARKRAPAADPILPIRSIAVLPLDNFSGDPSQDYFVDGMTDELITNLANISSLHVISRTSVMRYKGTKKALSEIGRELNVDGIIEGSVTRSGQRVRITAQLLYAPTDQHRWAETYERDLGDVLKLQSEVAEAIAQQVRAQVTPEQQVRLSSAVEVKPEAYDAFLRGRYYLTTQFSTAEPLKIAKNYFEESIRRDPGFALGYWGLADSYVYLAFFRQLSPDHAYRSAKDALRKALELDPSIGEVHDTLGLLSWRFDWDWATADHEFNRAIVLAPSYSCAHEDRSVYLGFTDRRAEALAEIAQSNELDPGPSSAMAESATFYQLRDYARLVETSRKGVASNPGEWVEHYNLGVGYEGTGKLSEAISEYQKAVEISNGDQDAIASLAHTYAVIGRRAEAEKILRELERKSKTAYVSPYILATIYAGLSNKDRAFHFLEKAYQDRSPEISWNLKADLRIDNLRSDPRFQTLLRRVGLQTSSLSSNHGPLSTAF